MSKRFRVAFSFSGSKRAYVAAVARILERCFGQSQILYDEFHRPEFARGRLALHLPQLYISETDLVVAVLCDDYADREWCGLEWDAICSLIKQGAEDAVLLARFGRPEAKGLYGLEGYLELDELPVLQAALGIVERLALLEGHDKDHYRERVVSGAMQQAGDWPDLAPTVKWPVADHVAVRSAFSALLTASSPFRLLRIHGDTGTGKSYLTQQLFNHGYQDTKIICGKFDFKGTANLGEALRDFAERLEVNAPEPELGVSRQLGRLLTHLKGVARPTLLIFDTFEEAGEAERWMRESLLSFLVRSPWLRVVIAGRDLLPAHGQSWAEVCGPAMKLASPPPAEWFIYGRNYKEKLTLKFVQDVYRHTDGKSAVMAQVLGPSELAE
jgi:hypothetical protein